MNNRPYAAPSAKPRDTEIERKYLVRDLTALEGTKRDDIAQGYLAIEGRRLQKTRHEYNCDGHVVHLDVYRGELEGLKVAEVEFDSEAEAQAFVPPSWFGREITEESVYRNRSLAADGLPEEAWA